MIAADETRAFAESVAGAIGRTRREPAPWTPGQGGDDRSAELTEALERAGWPAVGTDPELLPFAGPAGLELGRALAPLCEIDSLLGGSPVCGTLVRYHDASRLIVKLDARGGMSHVRVTSSRPRPYGDAIGVHEVLEGFVERKLPADEARARCAAWVAASIGYCAGVGERALSETVEYAAHRRAFGATLTALAPVQQMLAEAATSVRGIRLLAMDSPGDQALAYSGPALCDATALCQQVVGAIGFTLEFPLQRAYRRARTLQLWSDAVLEELARG